VDALVILQVTDRVKIAALVEELSDISARQPGDAAQHALDGGAELLSLLLLEPPRKWGR